MLKRFPIQQQRNPARGFATDPPAGGEFGVANPCERKEFTPMHYKKSSQKIQSPFDDFKNIFLIL
jgi:hypothetical protein